MLVILAGRLFRRHSLGRLLIVAALALAVVHLVSAAPQREAPNDRLSPADRPSMPVVVDGSKNPERIPDRVAIGMFMNSIAIPADADRRTIASMQVKIAPMRLSRSDVAILRGELARLHARLAAQREAIETSRVESGRVTASEAVAAVNARHSLAMESYTRLLETLSPEGGQKLAAQIGRVKTQMKAVGPAR